MRLNFLKKLVLAVAILYVPARSFAWGTEGHRIAGFIAESYLSPKAKAA
ncbi:MAG: S1/P1 Nuclease, partial [Bacteroidetes bacterium]|nr:S1/P1 Nuclease [Bacteroidota bacterium]